MEPVATAVGLTMEGLTQPMTTHVASQVPQLWSSHGQDVTDLQSAIEQEWLLANGTGAYAMGTVAGMNTRRYHGLFIAATHPPVGRIVALHQVIERLTLGRRKARQSIEFSANLFQDEKGRQVRSPDTPDLLRRFRKGCYVQWDLRWGKITFVRQLFLHWREQAATLRYVIRGLDASDAKASLTLGPMLSLRDFHSLCKTSQAGLHADISDDRLTARRGDLSVCVQCAGATCRPNSDPWWYNIYLPADAQRGEQALEDLYVPGWFDLELQPAAEHELLMTVSLGDEPADPCSTDQPRQAHLQPILDHLHAADDPTKRTLATATDDFVVDRTIKGQTLRTIMAGYPWFADWGRDTFIALPGLLLETGRFDEARDVLRAFAEAIHGGLVPNRFDDYDDTAAHYNTVDASLWFVHAAMQYRLTADDQQSWDDWLADAALTVIDAYIRGTDHGIRMAGDGLITAGSAQTQLTWMDAACGGIVFTPRHGKAVEINALWYHVLAGMAELVAETHREQADHFNRLLGRIRRSFAKVFWNDALDCLVDHVWTDDDGNDHIDRTLRPNQIFAASLPHSPIPRTKQTQVVDVVREHLLTPFGLRTLPATDPNYHGVYAGDAFARDKAYHQGTVWPWLIGPYAEAVLRVGRFSAKAKAEAQAVIDPLLRQLTGPGLGQLHEIHEGDPPHRPAGCIAQAWSVAEVLRIVRLIEKGCEN